MTRPKQQWFFKSTTGQRWHKYDTRCNKVIEEAVAAGKLCCDIPISGRIYTVDTVQKVQVIYGATWLTIKNLNLNSVSV